MMHIQKIIFALGAWAIACAPAAAQHPHEAVAKLDSFLRGGQPAPQVLLVGTFHFDYPNLDAHVTATDQQVDVLDAQRRQELAELLDYLGRFRPTKIVVEAWDAPRLNARYRQYLQDSFELGRNEIYQIGFRLARRMGHPQLYVADASTLMGDLYDGPDSLCFRPYLDSIYTDWDFRSDDPYSQRYSRLYRAEDAMLSEMSLLSYFLYKNADHRILRGHGAYLVGDFELGDTAGADALAMHWYSRNLRIFRRIQQLTTTPDDRILVLFGAGHLGILQHLFASSPAYELIKLGDLQDAR